MARIKRAKRSKRTKKNRRTRRKSMNRRRRGGSTVNPKDWISKAFSVL